MTPERFRIAAAACALGVAAASPALGFEDRTPRVHALVGARVVVKPGEVKENATIIVRDGVIVDVGTTTVPGDARVWPLDGKTVYAGLIEPYFDPKAGAKPASGEGEGEKKEKSAKGDAGVRHPNARVRAETRVVEALALDASELELLRAAGFTLAHLVPSTGMFRGQSALVQLRPGAAEQQIVRPDVAHIVAFDRADWGDQNPTYPSSLMGAVALVRQTFGDAAWAADATAVYASRRNTLERPRSNLAWDALRSALPEHGRKPVWMLTEDVLGSLRCAQLGKELDLALVLVGNGEEYKQAQAIRAAGYPVIVPVNYPKAPEFSDDEEAYVELDVLRHWDEAPANASQLVKIGVPMAFTTMGVLERKANKLKLDGDDFRARIQQAIERGLPADAALAGLTTGPAKLLGVERDFGSVEKGKVANLTITDGDLFAEKTQILEVWVDGERYEVRDAKRDDFDRVRGTWRIVAGAADKPEREWTLDVKGNEWTMRATVQDASGRAAAVQALSWERGELLVRLGTDEVLRLRPAGKKELAGKWQQSGREVDIEGSKTEPTLGGAR